MFAFTTVALLKDVLRLGLCLALTTAVYALALLSLRRREGASATPYLRYARDFFAKNNRLYGFAGLTLFFAVFACRLVLIRLILALCYSFAVLRLFMPKKP